MTKEEKIIATAFTGKMFIDGSDMGLLYEYMEKKVGHGVIDIMLADKAFWEELHRACEQDFIDMVSKEQPSLPADIDEAAEEWCKTNNKGIALSADKKSHYLAEGVDAFIAGAEWMAGQGWKEVSEADFPKPDKDKLYCVHTKQHYLLATVILHPNDDGLCQWRCTEFPHHRYDMCEGDSYLEIRKKQ